MLPSLCFSTIGGYGYKIFKFEITGSGDVINVNVMVDTAEHAEFEEAIKSRVGHWKLKSIEVGNTTVTVLFNFRE